MVSNEFKPTEEPLLGFIGFKIEFSKVAMYAHETWFIS